MALTKSIVQALCNERIIWKKSTPQNYSYLTFDDGPTVGVTDRILDLLDQHATKATFFVQGQKLERNMKLGEEIHRRGHLLANHSYTHERDIYRSVEKLDAEIGRTNDIIQSITRTRNRYFRPPWGVVRNASTLRSCYRLDMIIVLWSFDSGDSHPGRIGTTGIAEAGGNAIILLHDDNLLAHEILVRDLPLLLNRKFPLARLPTPAAHG